MSGAMAPLAHPLKPVLLPGRKLTMHGPQEIHTLTLTASAMVLFLVSLLFRQAESAMKVVDLPVLKEVITHV